MTYKGHIQQGVVVLDEEVALPEGVAVCVALAEEMLMLDRFKEGMRSFAGILHGLPEDLAERHDEYAHGGGA